MIRQRIGARIMTDKEGFADRGRDHAAAGDSPHAHQPQPTCRLLAANGARVAVHGGRRP
jgi:hypothetical protein